MNEKDKSVVARVLGEVGAERERQFDKWGHQDCSDAEWASIMGEEFGEACKEANDLNFKSINDPTAGPRLRVELIQMAAVAVAWIESYDRRIGNG